MLSYPRTKPEGILQFLQFKEKVTAYCLMLYGTWNHSSTTLKKNYNMHNCNTLRHHRFFIFSDTRIFQRSNISVKHSAAKRPVPEQ